LHFYAVSGHKQPPDDQTIQFWLEVSKQFWKLWSIRFLGTKFRGGQNFALTVGGFFNERVYSAADWLVPLISVNHRESKCYSQRNILLTKIYCVGHEKTKCWSKKMWCLKTQFSWCSTKICKIFFVSKANKNLEKKYKVTTFLCAADFGDKHYTFSNLE
jgi:hypothetical protein